MACCPFPLVARHSPVSSVASSPRHQVTRRACSTIQAGQGQTRATSGPRKFSAPCSGWATKEPRPCRTISQPFAASSSFARRITSRLTPYWSAISNSLGKRSSTASSPERISLSRSSYTWCHSSRGARWLMRSRLSGSDIGDHVRMSLTCNNIAYVSNVANVTYVLYSVVTRRGRSVARKARARSLRPCRATMNARR